MGCSTKYSFTILVENSGIVNKTSRIFTANLYFLLHCHCLSTDCLNYLAYLSSLFFLSFLNVLKNIIGIFVFYSQYRLIALITSTSPIFLNAFKKLHYKKCNYRKLPLSSDWTSLLSYRLWKNWLLVFLSQFSLNLWFLDPLKNHSHLVHFLPSPYTTGSLVCFTSLTQNYFRFFEPSG